MLCRQADLGDVLLTLLICFLDQEVKQLHLRARNQDAVLRMLLKP